MILKLTDSRNTLRWHKFEKTDKGDWILNLLPPFYADIFEDRFRKIMAKSNTCFRDSKNSKTRYAFFSDLTDAEIEQVEKFIEVFRTYVIIGLNKNIKEYFKDELNFCLALDFNFDSNKNLEYTHIGELVYNIKYKRKRNLTEDLAKELAVAVRRLPFFHRFKNICLTYVPMHPEKMFYLPKILAELLVEKIKDFYPLRKTKPLVHARLKIKKPEFKDLKFIEKICEWKKIMKPENITLTSSVRGNPVIIIDDLYQSGTTLWTYARFLKEQGAGPIAGLVCEKSLRDTHN